MPLDVVRETADDAARVVALESMAHKSNPSCAALFPGPFPKEDDDSRVKMLILQLEEDDACGWAKVVDTDLEEQGQDGSIAFIKWYAWEILRDTLPLPRQWEWGPGSNPEACELVFGGLR